MRTPWLDRLSELRESGHVRRAHTVRHLHEYTIAQHVYGSLLIAYELIALNEIPAMEECAIIRTLLVHDAPELDTGDTPAPVKRESSAVNAALDHLELMFYAKNGVELPQLGTTAAAIVKASDTLDLMWWCFEQRQMGVRHPRLDTVNENVCSYIKAQYFVKGVKEIATHLQMEYMTHGI